MRHATLGDTLYFWFAVNSTAGEATDATGTPTFDVRKGGATSSAIPTLEGSATLLSHANYPAGAYEIAIAATGGNGFEADAEYGVFCQAAVSSVNPIGYVGGFRLAPVPADAKKLGGTTQTGHDVGGTVATNLNATVSSRATQTSLDTLAGYVDTEMAAVLAAVDTEVAAIKAKTDLLPSETPGSAGGLFIAGTNAPVTITGSGDALTLTSTGGNGSGLKATGQGIGHGMNLLSGSGATGNSLNAVAQSTNGFGIHAQGSGTYDGIRGESGGGATGNGISGVALSTDGNGIYGSGFGSGDGMHAQGGATGRGLHLKGGATSGAGLRAEGQAGNADGVEMVAHGTGKDLDATSTNLALAKTTNITGFNDLDAAGVRSALGMASANLDTQLAAIAGYLDTEMAATLAAVDTEVAAIKAKTDNLPTDPADASDIAASFASITSLINGLNDLDAVGIRSALGMATNNLDTQLATIAGYLDTEVAAILAAVDTEVASIKTKTDQLAFTNAGKVDASLQAAGDVVAAVCNKLADHMHRRTQANVFASSDGDTLNLLSLYGMIQQLQNSGPMSGGSLPVKNTDGSALGTLTFTSNPSAEPVTGVTP